MTTSVDRSRCQICTRYADSVGYSSGPAQTDFLGLLRPLPHPAGATEPTCLWPYLPIMLSAAATVSPCSSATTSSTSSPMSSPIRWKNSRFKYGRPHHLSMVIW